MINEENCAIPEHVRQPDERVRSLKCHLDNTGHRSYDPLIAPLINASGAWGTSSTHPPHPPEGLV